MANEVIKKDGTKESFDPEKIRSSIRAATEHTDLDEARRNEIVEQVAKTAIELADSKEEITTGELREKILSELDNIESTVSTAWRKYEEEKSRGTEESEALEETASETPEGTEETAEGGESNETSEE